MTTIKMAADAATAGALSQCFGPFRSNCCVGQLRLGCTVSVDEFLTATRFGMSDAPATGTLSAIACRVAEAEPKLTWHD